MKRMIVLVSAWSVMAAAMWAGPVQRVSAEELAGTRICLLNLYQWSNNADGSVTVTPADPMVSGGWTTVLEGEDGMLTAQGGLSLYDFAQSMRVDAAAGTVTLEVTGEPVATRRGSKTVTGGTTTVTVDSTVCYYFMNEDWLVNGGPMANVTGAIEADGTIALNGGYGYYLLTARTTTTVTGNKTVTVSDTTRAFSPLVRDMRLVKPNGKHHFTDELDGTAHDVDLYIRQSGDTVWVTNLYGFGWHENYMVLDTAAVMTMPGQAFRDISDAKNPGGDGVWINATLNGDEAVPGNVGQATATAITWGLTVPTDNDGLWWGYDNNTLSYSDGSTFVIPTPPAPLEIGDVNGDGVVNIADVTALIDFLLNGDASTIALEVADVNGDGTVSIADVTSMIDFLLNGSW